MKTMKALLLCVTLVIGLCCSVNAEQYLNQFIMSSSSTTGTWKQDPQQSITYSTIYDHVCGGDVGVWFYTTQNPLRDWYVPSPDRVVYIYQYERDNSTVSLCKTYTGYFTTYEPTSYGNYYVNSGTVEDDGTAELFIEFLVTAIAGDGSNAVPSGLLYYRHWTV